MRLGSRRFLGNATAFDIIVGIMLGSIMSRAINGSAPLLPTLAAGAALLGAHWLFAGLSYLSRWLGGPLKGQPILLIKDGEIQKEGMRRAQISPNDLAEALRMQGKLEDANRVKVAYLERNGRISIIPYPTSDEVSEKSSSAGF